MIKYTPYIRSDVRLDRGAWRALYLQSSQQGRLRGAAERKRQALKATMRLCPTESEYPI